MAVLGRLLVSSAERLDLPDLLSLDSYAAGDWKYFLKGLVGDSKPFILKGFDVIDPGNAIGTQSCSIRVADSVTFYPGSNSGSFFHGLAENHPQAAPLVPELRKNAVNYVYLTFSTFNTSIDTRAFWDPDKDGGVGGEFTQDVNTESVLQVQVNVSTGSFPANTVPVAKITVGPVVITAIEDARDLMFRLGSGGINPNPFNTYAWRSLPGSQYARQEPSTTMLAGGVNPFQGADKNILTLKEWMDAIMSKLRELGGTTYWYDDTSSFGIITNFFDAVATTFKSKGKWVHDTTTPGLLTWTEDIQIKMTSDPRTYIVRQGSKTLDNEQVMYIPMIRNQLFNPTDESVSWINGQAYINTIGGAVGLFTNLSKGDYVKKANDSFDKWLRVEEFYDAVNLGGSTTTAAGARSVRLSSAYLGVTGSEKGRYDKGAYLAADVVVSDRDDVAIANTGGNFHWLGIRSDTIENIASFTPHTLSLAILDHDGSTAKVTSVAHGLVDGDRVTIAGTTNFNGTFKVEVETADVFYISLSGGPFADESGSGFYATVVSAARSTPYGFQEESANHGFESNDTIIVEGTSNYDDSYLINVINATTFTVPIDADLGAEAVGTATLARVIVRSEGGGIDLIQGQVIDIGGSIADNIRQYLGMGSLSETAPNYAIAPGYNTLDGMQNYNGVVNENITARVSKLTAMMADKAQDKAIRALPSSGITSINNTTNGAAQEITFTPAGGSLTFATPGSDGQAFVALPSSAPGISLLVNQAAYVTIDRNNPSSPSIVVADLIDTPIEENTFIVAMRLATTDVYLWEGSIIQTGGSPGPGYLTTVVKQNQALKLVAGGTWLWNGTNLSWSAAAAIQVPGLANSVNNIAAGSIALASGQVAYVDINRVGPGGSLTVNVAANASLAMTTDRFIIAREDGGDVIVGAHSMRLVTNESKKLYAGISDQNLQYIGGTSGGSYTAPDAADSTPDYTNATGAAVANVNLVDGENLTLGIKRLDIASGAGASIANQDRNTKMIKGGTWSWNSGLSQLTFTADAYIQVPGLSEDRNTIPFSTQSPISLVGDGQAAWVSINRTVGGPTNLTVSVTAITAVPDNASTLIIARRVGSDVLVGNGTIRLINGQSQLLEEGMSDQTKLLLGGTINPITEATVDPVWATRGAPLRTISSTDRTLDAIASADKEVDKFFGQLRLTPNATPFKVNVSDVDKTMLDNVILSQELKNLVMSFTGAVINFSTGAILANDDSTPLGINFTPFSIPVGQYFWYGIGAVPNVVTADNRITAQILITPAASANASASAAPLAAIAGTKKIGMIQIWNNGGSLQVNAVRQLGVGSGSGSGTGDANEILERLEFRLVNSPWEWVEPNIFSVSEDDKVSSATATYDVANTWYKFTGIGQNLVSIQSLDAEFLTENADVASVELMAFWDTTGIDPAATYEVSRNGGTDWKTVTMARVGNTTETFRGIYTWPTDTTYTTLSTYALANANAFNELNTTTVQAVSTIWSVPAAPTEWNVQQATLYINKVGSALGKTLVQLIKDNGSGKPSTNVLDIVAQTQVDNTALTVGDNTVVLSWGNNVLSPGNYHYVISTDSAYKTGFSAGVASVRAKVDNTAPPTPINELNAGVWTANAALSLVYVVSGRALDLRVRITSSAANVFLKGYGIFYGRSLAVVSGLKNREVQAFNGTTDNYNTFTLSNFLPDPDLLKVYHVETGQVYTYGTGGFSLSGYQVIFPANTFNGLGTVTLAFDQLAGTSFDNSDQNASLLAANFLGSTDATIDKSQNGRGIFLRRPDGTLREITIDNSDNIVVYSV